MLNEYQLSPSKSVVIYKSEGVSHSVLSDSVGPCGLQPTKLFCLWDSPGKNTGVGSHSLLQGIFPTQKSNPGLPYCRWICYWLSHQGNLDASLRPLRILLASPLPPAKGWSSFHCKLWLASENALDSAFPHARALRCLFPALRPLGYLEAWRVSIHETALPNGKVFSHSSKCKES